MKNGIILKGSIEEITWEAVQSFGEKNFRLDYLYEKINRNHPEYSTLQIGSAVRSFYKIGVVTRIANGVYALVANQRVEVI